MGMQLISGRDFTPLDKGQAKPRNVIVNQALARKFFSNIDAVGQVVGIGFPGGPAPPSMLIIGVVSDAKYRSLREEIPPTVYGPLSSDFESGFVLHLRTRDEPASVMTPVREILRKLDPQLPFVEVKTLREEVEVSLWQERLLAALSSIFGLIAAILASIGLYAALDYAVKARTREIGIRAALGAAPARIATLLWGETFLLVACGLALGLLAHAAVSVWIRQVLYGVQPGSVAAIASSLAILLFAALVATLPATLRALRIHPASALRQE